MRDKAYRVAHTVQTRLQTSEVSMVNVYHYTKFRGDRSNHC